MGNTNNNTYSEVIQYNGSEINLNKLIRPEYIGELEVDRNKYNYIININKTILKILSFFEESYNTKEIQQTSSDTTNTTWIKPLYNEWKDLITKEVNIYKPNFGSGDTGTINETKFTNCVMNEGGITFRILGKTLLPILINIIINKNTLENIDLKAELLTTRNIESNNKSINNSLQELMSPENNYDYKNIYELLKSIYINLIKDKEIIEKFQELSLILRTILLQYKKKSEEAATKSANGGKFQRSKFKKGKSKRGKSKRGKSKGGKSKGGKSKKKY